MGWAGGQKSVICLNDSQKIKNSLKIKGNFETEYTDLVFISTILLLGILHSVRYIFVFFFVRFTFRQNSVLRSGKNDLISAATLDCLDWIGFRMTFEKEFFPFLRYIIRFFTKELSCTQSLEEVARELASNKTQRNQESRHGSLFNWYVLQNLLIQFSSVVSELVGLV